MKQLDSEGLKKIQIEILDVVTDFCDKNNIKYGLYAGTLLGAVRHKGYIPWDDDIDIVMLREDYDKFMALFNLSNERYRFMCIENNKNCHVPFGKVLDTNTVLYEPDIEGDKLAVNIDIFIYDNAPDNDKQAQKMFDTRDYLRSRISYTNSSCINNEDSIIKKAMKKLLKLYFTMLGRERILLKMVKNSKKYANKDKKKVGSFTEFSRVVCDKDIFGDFVYLEFEGKMYKAPVGWDKLLTALYADYMTLPPKEKQVTHHSFVAYAE